MRGGFKVGSHLRHLLLESAVDRLPVEGPRLEQPLHRRGQPERRALGDRHSWGAATEVGEADPAGPVCEGESE